MTDATSATPARSAASEVSAEDLVAVLGTPRAPVLVDVREPDEFEAWAIPGAHNVPLSSLARQLGAVERLSTAGEGHRVVVVCASGERSAKAVATLRAGGVDAANLAGGMAAWAGIYDTAALELGPFAVVQVRRRGKGCLSYVVASEGHALVVDPPSDIGQCLEIVTDRKWQVEHVVDTHLHADHVSGARALAAATRAELHLSPRDQPQFPYSPLTDGERLELGREHVEVLAAPGHTLGSVVLDLGGPALITGDTLFVDGVGRPDLADHATEYADELHRSLVRVLAGRGDEVLVLPAHYGDAVEVVPQVLVAATLGAVRAAVPQLGWERDRFVSWASSRAAPRPPSYVQVIRLNSGQTAATPEEVRALELGPNRCSAA